MQYRIARIEKMNNITDAIIKPAAECSSVCMAVIVYIQIKCVTVLKIVMMHRLWVKMNFCVILVLVPEV